MALNAKGIAACFLGSAQLSAQVREDAWRGRFEGVLSAVQSSTQGFLGAGCLSFQLVDSTLLLPPFAGRYQFIYVTPELAANAIDRFIALKNSTVSKCHLSHVFAISWDELGNTLRLLQCWLCC
jgi:hypothetical protein